MLRKLAQHIQQYKKSSVLAILFSMLEVVTDITIPILMARIIDLGIQAGDMSQVWRYGLFMLVAVILGLIGGTAAGRFSAKAASGFAHNLRDAIFLNIQTFSFSNIDKFSTAGLVTRLTTDVTNVQNAYQMIVRMLVRAPLMFISALVMSIIIAPQIAPIYLIIVGALIAALFLIIRRAMPIFREVFEGYDHLNASVQENVTGIRVVKGFVREPHEENKFKATVEQLYKKFVKAESTVALNNPVMMTAIYACLLAVSWLGANMVVGGTLSTGELTSLFSYVMSMLMNLMMLSMVMVMMTLSISNAQRIAEVLDEEADIINPEKPVYEVKDGRVSFEKVSFSYHKTSENRVLREINLDIQSGETIGIMGGTGSSKTSLVNLISRLYDVTEGSVKVGGIDVRDYDLEVLRDKVAVVLQKNNLFSGTILDNLRWGNKDATLEECIAACKMASAHNFIESFPDGYNTHIEQGGTNVSGGQKQRLCIARALLKNPKVLILDDSTSAVDTATDARIRKAFLEEIPDTTKFIIAQRISSIKDADRIIYMADGKVTAIGTHAELYATNETYKTVYDNQEQSGGDFDKKGEL